MKCTDCKYSLKVDYGYFNWTVEGTDVYCLLNLNPDLPVDHFYGEEPYFLFAEKCDKFCEGISVEIDCDRVALADYEYLLSSAYTDDPEIKLLLDKWESRGEKDC